VVRTRNAATFTEAVAWSARHSTPHRHFHVLHFPDLPPRHAGVGLARKIGMDEALVRLAHAGHVGDGIIAGFDADCLCDRNYLVALEEHFRDEPGTPACSIYFEHPLEEPIEPEVREAACAYELHLRYYVQALRFAGFPHAFHTVGSSMAVRAGTYLEQGGMNRRQAGEDFYFLHKIIPLGGFTELNGTCVRPSPRPSTRVPFGTGRAVGARLEGGPALTYPLEAFLDLGAIVRSVASLRADPPAAHAVLPAASRTFLAEQKFESVLEEIRRNTTSDAAFTKRFFRWFDGFRAMKFIHHARDRHYGARPIASESARLLRHAGWPDATLLSETALLAAYRDLDRAGRWLGRGD
jgi:hypothetical protein